MTVNMKSRSCQVNLERKIDTRTIVNFGKNDVFSQQKIGFEFVQEKKETNLFEI